MTIILGNNPYDYYVGWLAADSDNDFDADSAEKTNYLLYTSSFDWLQSNTQMLTQLIKFG